MTSLAAQGTEDEQTGCSHDGGELCFHYSPVEYESMRLDFWQYDALVSRV